MNIAPSATTKTRRMSRGLGGIRCSSDESATVRSAPPQKSHSISTSFTITATVATSASSLKCNNSNHSKGRRGSRVGRSLSFSSTHSGGSRGHRHKQQASLKRTLSLSSDEDSMRFDISSSRFQLQQQLFPADDQTTSSSSTPPCEQMRRETRASVKQPSHRNFSNDSTMLKLNDELTVNKLRFALLDIYGRDQERDVLMDIIRRSTITGSSVPMRDFVLISGSSGVGKTSLAGSVKRGVRRTGGAFVSGKFDTNRTTPYSAILTACTDLCCQLLAMNKNKSNTSAESVGLNVADYSELLKIIPDLGAVVDKPVPLCYNGNGNSSNSSVDCARFGSTINTANTQGAVVLHESKNRFHYLFRKFFWVTAALLEGPQVVVLDDLQWADFASLELLEALLNDSKGTSRDEISNLIIFGLYRSTEMTPSNMLSHLIRNAKQRAGKSNFRVTEIELNNLDEYNIRELLLDLISSTDIPRVQSLAAICHKKTKGNPFFLVQYLTMLHEKDLLQYNFGTCSWIWDEEKIQSETKATENVVDLMNDKMRDLPSSLSKLLEVAACLGSTFTHSTLEHVWSSLAVKPTQPFEDIILSAVTYGFLERNQKDTCTVYQWVHDSILESATALLPEEELKALQYEMGSILVSQSDKNHLGSIFVAVNLLNEGMPATSNTDTQLELARSNLAAALNAVNVSAFESASKYVSKGVTLMPVDSWSRHQSLALELHSLGAEVNGCLGNIAEMELHCNKVLEQDIPLLDKMRVYYVILDSTADRQNIPKALHLCMEVLKNLGCTFPRCALSVNIVTIANVLKFQSQADSRSLDEIANMAPMTDRRRIEVMRLLDKLATYCYLSENILFPVTILRRLKYTLCYGVTDYSAVDFVGLALILTAKLLDFQAGSAYANYSMLLLERIDSKRSHSRVYMVAYAFVFPWTQPTQSVLKYLLMAYEYGIMNGDTESAMYAIMGYIYNCLQSGRSLQSVEADCRIYLPQMEDLKREKARRQTKTIFQAVLNLMGKSADPCVLTGEAMDEEMMTRICNEEQDKVVLAMMQALRMQLLATFGRYDEGSEIAISTGNKLAHQIPGSTMVAVDPFFRALCLYGMAKKNPKLSTKFQRHAHKAHQTINTYLKKGNPNVRHLKPFLDAEKASLKHKNYQVALNNYEVATVMASRHGFQQDAALANEHFGKFLLDCMKDEEMAAFRIHRAIRLYYEWGSPLKGSMLEKEYENLLFTYPDSRIGFPASRYFSEMETDASEPTVLIPLPA